MADAPTLYGSTSAQAQAHLRAGTRWAGRYPIGTEAEAEFRIPGRWAATADLMRRTDPKLAAFSSARTDPILQARYEVVPGVGPNAERNASYIRRALGLAGRNAPRVCAKSFESIIASAVLALDDGFRIMEPIIGAGPDGLWWPVDVVDVESYSIWAFNRDATGALASVEQVLTQTGWLQPMGRVVVSADRLLVFTSRQTGDNYAGVGALRACYSPWLLKRDIPELARQALARYAIPTLVVTKSLKALQEAGWPDADIQSAFEAADTAAANLQAGESTFLVAVGENGNGVGWSVLGNGQDVNADVFVKLTELADRQMAAAFGASVAEMGTTGEGSRAIGQVHLDILRRGLANQLDTILAVLGGPARPGGGLFARLLGLNFGPIPNEELPQVVQFGLEVDGLADALGALPSLAAAGFVDPAALSVKVARLLGAESGVAPAPAVQPVPPAALEGVPQVGGGGRPEGSTV